MRKDTLEWHLEESWKAETVDTEDQQEGVRVPGPWGEYEVRHQLRVGRRGQ